jgi:hypothetical protein
MADEQKSDNAKKLKTFTRVKQSCEPFTGLYKQVFVYSNMHYSFLLISQYSHFGFHETLSRL